MAAALARRRRVCMRTRYVSGLQHSKIGALRHRQLHAGDVTAPSCFDQAKVCHELNASSVGLLQQRIGDKPKRCACTVRQVRRLKGGVPPLGSRVQVCYSFFLIFLFLTLLAAGFYATLLIKKIIVEPSLEVPPLVKK